MTLAISSRVRDHFSEVKETISKISKRTSPGEKFCVALNLMTTLRLASCTSSKLLNNRKCFPVFGGMKIATLGLVPFNIYQIATSLFSDVKKTVNEKIDLALGIGSNLGAIGGTFCTVIEGLTTVGIIAIKTLNWLTPVVFVSSGLECLDMVSKAKNFYETHRFSKLFTDTCSLNKPVEKYNLDDFRKGRQLIREKSQEDSFVFKHFKTNKEKLNQRLETIENEVKLLLSSNDTQLVQQGKKKIKTTMDTLKNRLSNQKYSDVLNLLIGTISLIGFGVLFTPMIPAGFAILAVAGVLSLTHFFIQKAKTNQFEKELGIE